MAQAELNPANDELAQIRESVRAVCAKFPGEYWRALDRERAYPTEFVAALTQAGFLAALIPEEYGGSGLRMAAADCSGRTAVTGFRRHRADIRFRHAQSADDRRARGRSLHRQWTEDLDVACRAFGPSSAHCPHHSARSREEAHRRPFGVPRRHAPRATHR